MGNLKKTAVISFLIMALCGVSMAATIYQVGDAAGWTSMGGVDYQGWADSKNFQVGDTLVFNYNNQFHNVELVRTYQDFETCNASFTLATYTNGFDTIYLDRPGHFYFICGFPGHCQMGQRVDISVSPATSRTPSPAYSPSNSPTTSASSYLYVPKLTFSVLAFCLLGFVYCFFL